MIILAFSILLDIIIWYYFKHFMIDKRLKLFSFIAINIDEKNFFLLNVDKLNMKYLILNLQIFDINRTIYYFVIFLTQKNLQISVILPKFVKIHSDTSFFFYYTNNNL